MSSIKRDVKKKVLPRPEVEKIFVSRSSPLSVSAPRFRSRGFALACLPFLWVSSCGGDDANRVLKLGKRTWSWSVNHGSIGGSWPIAISGYPRSCDLKQCEVIVRRERSCPDLISHDEYSRSYSGKATTCRKRSDNVPAIERSASK